jgi:pSer/pThr/pTyr-binding forkhead associated (FHA) protein
MSQNSVTLRFEIVRDGEVVRTEELDQDVIKIGKLASSHLRLEDPNASRIHAVVEKGSDGSYSVIDLGSASGTFVNGEKVTKAAISSGDELQFGDTMVRVDFVEASQDTGADMEFGGTADATVVTGGLEESLDQDRQQASSAAGQANQGQANQRQTSQPQQQASAHSDQQSQDGGQGQQQAEQQPITLEDGSVVYPYTQQGYYDDNNNYIPYWYDAQGEYHPGYGYHDDAGEWEVAYGYYDPDGEWIATEQPVGFVDQQQSDANAYQGPSDNDVYQEEFFDGSGGDTLEVAMLWADHVLSVTSFPQPRTVTIGPDRENDFVIEDAAVGQAISFPFIASRDGSYFLTFTQAMGGFVQNGDKRYSLSEAIEQGIAKGSSEAPSAYEVPIGKRTSARIDIGGTTFLVHFTDMPAVIGGGLAFDMEPLPYLAASAVAHLLLLFLAMTLPDDAKSLDLDGFQADDRFVEMMMKPEQEEEEEPDWLDDKGDEEEAAKHKGEEGQAGKEDAEQEDKRMAIKGPPDNQDMELKKAKDTEAAMNAGVMKVFNSNQVSSMWGNSSQSVGSDAIHALGNLDGNSAGTAKGFGGLGVAGAGRGGGGVSERGIGMNNVGTAGRGGGGRGGSGYGQGAGNLGEKDDKMPTVIPGKPLVKGSLDKEIIQRVIRKHRREISFCYEQQLQKNKNLAGRIKVKFTISGTGDVIAAMVRSSTLKNRAVENCVTSKIRRWVFPEPKGGGIVVVNYPFNFSRQ